MYSKPRLYTKVVDRNGNVLLSTKYTTREVINPQTAYTMYDLLKGPVSPGGTGPSAKYGAMPVAGKTGTATDLKDLWFCGLTPYYSAAVWIGNDDDKQFYNLSSNDAALIWGELMKQANANLPIVDILPPAGLTVTLPDITVAPSKTPVATPNTTVTPPKTKVTPPKTKVTIPKTKVTPPKTKVTPPKTTVTPPKTPVTPPKTPVTPPKTPVTPPKTPVTPPKTPVTPPKTPVTPPKTPVTPPKTPPKTISNNKK
jgi:penicillin-binding protein 1A